MLDRTDVLRRILKLDEVNNDSVVGEFPYKTSSNDLKRRDILAKPRRT